MKISIIGAGSWGTALGVLLGHKGLPATLWVRRDKLRQKILQTRENKEYLPGVLLPENINLTSNLEEAVRGMDLLILAVPSHAIEEICTLINPFVNKNVTIVNVAKGLEEKTLRRISQVIEDSMGSKCKIAVLSGPNHAEEVGRLIPTASVVASREEETAKKVQDVFMSPHFRVYTNPDITGVELGGALKNVIAIAAGLCEGLGYGDNTLAAVITRGLAEITRLGIAMGAKSRTFSGLTGVGDLFVTCTSPHSRNRYVGLMLGKGKSLKEITSSMKMVAEGIKSTCAAYRLSLQYGVNMPISTEVYNILFREVDPREATVSLMQREKTVEMEDIAFD
ncbi:MAG: NAD(P)H-dependent glycerol-3-phosphate dehydrogenase [Firmicutes bacterium]|nr:NAD(P)H-dependent glycerol-3-phosphate dehydrogenase [Bacillota bacterium]